MIAIKNPKLTPTDNDLITFGKHKGKPYTFLKEVPKYCEWLMTETGDTFALDIKEYIRQNIGTSTPIPTQPRLLGPKS